MRFFGMRFCFHCPTGFVFLFCFSWQFMCRASLLVSSYACACATMLSFWTRAQIMNCRCPFWSLSSECIAAFKFCFFPLHFFFLITFLIYVSAFLSNGFSFYPSSHWLLTRTAGRNLYLRFQCWLMTWSPIRAQLCFALLGSALIAS